MIYILTLEKNDKIIVCSSDCIDHLRTVKKQLFLEVCNDMQNDYCVSTSLFL
jgi:hypothetical protein